MWLILSIVLLLCSLGQSSPSYQNMCFLYGRPFVGSIFCSCKVWIHDFEVQLVRLSLGKPPTSTFIPGVHTGKMNADKIGIVTDAWVRHIARQHPDHNIAQLASYIFADKDVGNQDTLGDEVLTSLLVSQMTPLS